MEEAVRLLANGESSTRTIYGCVFELRKKVDYSNVLSFEEERCFIEFLCLRNESIIEWRHPNVEGGKTGSNLLHVAVILRSPMILEWLLQRGFNPNLGDIDKSTPLNYACGRWNSECLVRLLLSYGANPNIPNSQGYYPLHIALQKEVIQLLFIAGANPNLYNNRGETPMHHACDRKFQYKIDILLAKDIERGCSRQGDSDIHITSYHLQYDGYIPTSRLTPGCSLFQLLKTKFGPHIEELERIKKIQ